MGGSPVVLIVEDDWLLRDCIAAFLRAARWDVLLARSAEAALSFLAAAKPIDVVFTDIELGGTLDGWEVGARFRRALPHIPVIYASGKPPRSELAVPDSAFFPKPYDPHAIVSACRASLNGTEEKPTAHSTGIQGGSD
jgi:two-component system, response regulator PdtaR